MNKNQEIFCVGAAFGAVVGIALGFGIEYAINTYHFEPKLIKEMTPLVVIYEHPKDDNCYVYTLRSEHPKDNNCYVYTLRSNSFKVPIIKEYDSYPLLKNKLK